MIFGDVPAEARESLARIAEGSPRLRLALASMLPEASVVHSIPLAEIARLMAEAYRAGAESARMKETTDASNP